MTELSPTVVPVTATTATAICVSVDPVVMSKGIVKYVTSPVSSQPKVIPVGSGLPLKVVSPHKPVVVKTVVSSSGGPPSVPSPQKLPSAPVTATHISSASPRCVLSPAVSVVAPPSLKISMPSVASRGSCVNVPVSAGHLGALETSASVSANAIVGVSTTVPLTVINSGCDLNEKRQISDSSRNGFGNSLAKKGENFILKVASTGSSLALRAREEEEDTDLGDEPSVEATNQEQRQNSIGEVEKKESEDGGVRVGGFKRRHELTSESFDSNQNVLSSSAPEKSAKRARLVPPPSLTNLTGMRGDSNSRVAGYQWNPRNRHFSHQHNIRPRSFLEELCEVGDMYGIEEVKTTPASAEAGGAVGYALDELEKDWVPIGMLLSSQLEMWEGIELMNRDQLLKLHELKDVSFSSTTTHHHLLLQQHAHGHVSLEGGVNHNQNTTSPTAAGTGVPGTVNSEGTFSHVSSFGGATVVSNRRNKSSLDTLKKLVAKNEDLISLIEDVSTELSKVDSLKEALMYVVNLNDLTSPDLT